MRKLRHTWVEKRCIGNLAPRPVCDPVCCGAWRASRSITCPLRQRRQLREVIGLRGARQPARPLKFPGWVIHPALVMSSHCVTLSGSVSPSDPRGHPFTRFWGCSTPGERLGIWQKRPVLVGSWGRVGRKCLPCQRLFSDRI